MAAVRADLLSCCRVLHSGHSVTPCNLVLASCAAQMASAWMVAAGRSIGLAVVTLTCLDGGGLREDAHHHQGAYEAQLEPSVGP